MNEVALVIIDDDTGTSDDTAADASEVVVTEGLDDGVVAAAVTEARRSQRMAIFIEMESRKCGWNAEYSEQIGGLGGMDWQLGIDWQLGEQQSSG